jgi:hypothetical protein
MLYIRKHLQTDLNKKDLKIGYETPEILEIVQSIPNFSVFLGRKLSQGKTNSKIW